jgi:hypothetical protein
LNVLIVLSHIVCNLLLLVEKNVNEDLNNILSFVIDNEKIFPEWIVDFVIKELIDFLAFLLYLLASLFIMHILVSDLVWSCLLQDVESYFT